MRLKLGRLDLVIHVLCLLCLVGTCVYLAVRWGAIPDQIPGKYDIQGAVIRTTGKGMLLPLPLLAWVLYLGLSALEQFPQIWNTGVRVTAENQGRVYRVLGQLLCVTKLSVVVIFCGLTVWMTTARPMPAWGVPALMLLILAPVGLFLVRLVRAARPRC